MPFPSVHHAAFFRFNDAGDQERATDTTGDFRNLLPEFQKNLKTATLDGGVQRWVELSGNILQAFNHSNSRWKHTPIFSVFGLHC